MVVPTIFLDFQFHVRVFQFNSSDRCQCPIINLMLRPIAALTWWLQQLQEVQGLRISLDQGALYLHLLLQWSAEPREITSTVYSSTRHSPIEKHLFSANAPCSGVDWCSWRTHFVSRCAEGRVLAASSALATGGTGYWRLKKGKQTLWGTCSSMNH